MAVNETWRLAPWADALYACDPDWWAARAPSLDEFRGLRIIGSDSFPGCVEANVRADHYQLIWDGDEIGSGGNGAFQAMNLVLRWGAKRVVLTGVDCQGEHWHGPHENGLRNPRQKTFDKWIAGFNNAARDLKRMKIEVVNCSRVTALTAFPIDKLENVL